MKVESGKLKVMAAYAFNLLDLAFTLHTISHGGVELNPLMRNVPFMVVSKTILVGAMLWWLGRRKEKIAKVGLWICMAYFGAIVMWHIWNLAACWVAFYFA